MASFFSSAEISLNRGDPTVTGKMVNLILGYGLRTNGIRKSKVYHMKVNLFLMIFPEIKIK